MDAMLYPTGVCIGDLSSTPGTVRREQAADASRARTPLRWCLVEAGARASRTLGARAGAIEHNNWRDAKLAVLKRFGCTKHT
jgi:hypothetical protein